MLVPLMDALTKLPKFVNNAPEAEKLAMAARSAKNYDNALFKAHHVYRNVKGEYLYAIDPAKTKINTKNLVKFIQAKAEGKKKIMLLKDVMDNEELFQIYPQLRTIAFNALEDTGDGARGSFSRREYGFHELSVDFTDAVQKFQRYQADGKEFDGLKNSIRQLRETFYHELQHAIQAESGRVGGGNPAAFVRPSLRPKIAFGGEMEQTFIAARTKAEKNSQVVRDLKKIVSSLNGRADLTAAQRQTYKKMAFDKAVAKDPAWVKKWVRAQTGVQDLNKARTKMHDLYESIAGEIEARKVGAFGKLARDKSRFDIIPLDPAGKSDTKAIMPPSQSFKDVRIGVKIEGKTYALPSGTPDEKVKAFVLKKLGVTADGG